MKPEGSLPAQSVILLPGDRLVVKVSRKHLQRISEESNSEAEGTLLLLSE